MSFEAMKQALETLEENHHLIEEHEHPDYLALYDRRIHALRTAIEQAEFDAAHEALEKQAGIHVSQQPAPVQEPKQSEIFCGSDFSNGILTVCVFCRRPDGVAELLHFEQTELQPPAAQRQWVGLTDEEIGEIEDEYIVDYRIPAGSAWNFAKDIEAKLREKNGAAHRQFVGLDAADWFKWWRTATVLEHTQAEIDFADFLLIATAVQDVLEKKNGAGQRLWIGLTQEQRNEIVFNAADEESATYQTEDKLRELNGGKA